MQPSKRISVLKLASQSNLCDWFSNKLHLCKDHRESSPLINQIKKQNSEWDLTVSLHLDIREIMQFNKKTKVMLKKNKNKTKKNSLEHDDMHERMTLWENKMEVEWVLVQRAIRGFPLHCGKLSSCLDNRGANSAFKMIGSNSFQIYRSLLTPRGWEKWDG